MLDTKYVHAAIIGILSSALLYLVMTYFNGAFPVFNNAVRVMLSVLISGYLIYRFLYRRL
jgi:hypothetical protein